MVNWKVGISSSHSGMTSFPTPDCVFVSPETSERCGEGPGFGGPAVHLLPHCHRGRAFLCQPADAAAPEVGGGRDGARDGGAAVEPGGDPAEPLPGPRLPGTHTLHARTKRSNYGQVLFEIECDCPPPHPHRK